MSDKLRGMSLSEGKRNLRAVGADEPITVEDILAHPSEAEFEHEFESLLDELGDSEFGAVAAASEPKEAGATLRNWTTQDFAVIYTRFRPHLERYAKRWLQNPSQIDEVVQDAFLYLMVTLPELDSELGVLRFLKWKTRLICLDVLRASGRAVLKNIDDHEMAANLPEHSAALEAADDAAVVRLALSKLNPRHREVLLATMYEEKSISEVASQVDLSENATRQLLFRARAAFKVALIGDVDTAGMSAGAILSVAARKAGSELREQSSRALVSLFILILAVGSYFTFTGHGSDHAPIVVAQRPTQVTPGGAKPVAVRPLIVDPAVSTTDHAPVVETFDRSSLAATNDGVEVNEAALRATMNQGVPQQVSVVPSALQAASVGGPKSYIVSCETRGCAASFNYSPKFGFQNFQFNLTVDGYDFNVYVLNTAVTRVGDKLIVTGNLSDLIDAQQVVWSDTALQGATVRLEFKENQILNGIQNAVLTVGIN